MALGDIVGRTSRWEFDSTETETPSLCKLSEGYCAVVHEDAANDGVMKTFAVSDAGIITPTGITWEFDTTYAEHPKMIHISGDVYVIVYKSSSGELVTVHISDTGVIGSEIDRYTFQGAAGEEPDICHLQSNLYAITNWGVWLTIVEISTGGVISKPIESTLAGTTNDMWPHTISCTS